jgi:hypothetical protein
LETIEIEQSIEPTNDENVPNQTNRTTDHAWKCGQEKVEQENEQRKEDAWITMKDYKQVSGQRDDGTGLGRDLP